MCGLVGFVSNLDWKDCESVAAQMLSYQTHRGPDFHSFHITSTPAGNLVLGHNLLSIIGSPVDGRQPFITQWGCLVFNGAIYNFKELRDTLSYKFRTETDTEVLAVGLGLEGLAFVSRLRGMFSFAYHSYVDQKLFLVRDSFGVKPLYYILRDNTLSFASEYKSLLPFYSDIKISSSAVSAFLRKRYVPGNVTLVEEVKKIEPSTILELNLAQELNATTRRYDPDIRISNDVDLNHCLEKAIERRRVASVEVAALLSGGIDSGLVCDYLSKGNNNLKSYTLDVGEESISEANKAAAIASRLQIEHFVIPHHKPSLSQLRSLAYHLDDPYGDPIILSLDNIFSHIRGHQRVVVTGEGADELFSGYVHHRAIGLFDLIPNFFVKFISFFLNIIPSTIILKLLPYAGKASPDDFKVAISRFRKFISHPNLSSFHSIFHLFDDTELKEDSLQKETSAATLLSVREWDFRNWLPHSQLYKLDKISMKSSIEAREPYVDIDLFRFVQMLPPNENIKLKMDKYILRKAVSRFSRIPKDVIFSRKTSFFQPINKKTSDLFLNELKGYIIDNRLFLENFLKAEAIDKLVGSNEDGLLFQKKIFCLAALALWNEQIFRLVSTSQLRLEMQRGFQG